MFLGRWRRIQRIKNSIHFNGFETAIRGAYLQKAFLAGHERTGGGYLREDKREDKKRLPELHRFHIHGPYIIPLRYPVQPQ